MQYISGLELSRGGPGCPLGNEFLVSGKVCSELDSHAVSIPRAMPVPDGVWVSFTH